MKSKVVSNPTREPINRQSALVMRKASWIEQPIADSPENKEELMSLREEVKQLKAKSIAQAQHLTGLRKQIDRYRSDLDDAAKRLSELSEKLSGQANEATGQDRINKEKAAKRAKTLAVLATIRHERS